MMRKPSLLTGFVIGLLLTTGLAAILFVVGKAVSTPYPPFDLFNLAARVLPGDVIRLGERTIITLVSTFQLGQTDVIAKQIEQFVIGVPQWILLGGLVSAIFFAGVRNRLAASSNLRQQSLVSGLILGILFGIPMMIISGQYDLTAQAAPAVSAVILGVAYLGWGWAHGSVYSQIFAPAKPTAPTTSDAPVPAMPAPIVAPESPVQVINRREFLIRLGGSTAVITVIGAGLGAILSARPGLASQTSRGSVGEPAPAGTTEPVTARKLPNADDPLVPAPGTRLEYTPLEKHYRIDISTGGAPRIDREGYKLPITGLVENPVEISLDKIRAMPSMDQYITMSCISNPVGGDLISTTLWSGVSMQEILDLVKPTPKATHIRIDSADGFYEFVEITLIRNDPRAMLAYAWDGQPLPDLHGWPLRIHIPDRYGMKQPKWITRMEFIEGWQPGFWVERGWDKDAIVKATSVIDSIAVDSAVEQGDKKLIPVGGMAWAGVRGISKVEVQVDDGPWVEASLRRPLSDKTWVIWRYEWPFSAGQHTFSVRCVEKDGTKQIEIVADVAPSGATGIYSETVRA